jgi:transcriptional regulator with XRE-family HTH domain
MPRYDGHFIQHYRQRAGKTQAQLADLLGRQVSTVARWEANTVIPSAGLLGHIAAKLGCEVSDLYSPDDPDDPVTAYSTELAELIAKAPPLTTQQRRDLAALVRGGS